MATGNSATNFFASKVNQGDLTTINNTYYNYGTTPNTPVAEQNQTYFAYFDGVSGTGPEIIDQTAYSIKYLIDTNGNVVNPEPDTIANRPQAIGLYNLLNNFEVGTNAVVKLIESDPTLTENPNDDALVGKYPVTHIGRLVLLATSEYSTINTDFLTTMSFQEYGTYLQGGDPPNFSFLAWKEGNQNFLQSPSSPTFLATTMEFTDIQSNDLEYYNNTDTYIFGDSTSTYGLAVSFEVGTHYEYFKASQNQNSISTFNYWIEYTEDNITWEKLPIFIVGDPSSSPPNTWPRVRTNTGIINDNVYIQEYITEQTYQTSPQYYHTVRTFPRSFLNGTRVRVRFKNDYIYNEDNSSQYSSIITLTLYGSPSTSGGTRFSLINSTGFSNKVTASYFDNISSPTTAPPFLPQSLTASLNFSAYINNDYVQILPSSSIEFDYQQPSYPLNIQPGDFIRCEYNPDQVATIVEVTAVNESPSRTCLKIFPPVIPSGSTLNHFTIYRVLNDGSNIILNVPKPVRGNSFSGVIQPEFVTKELVNKYDKIIVDLTEREIIQ
jgi:hypothetical protein